jgi:tetratricopeptide (TPR) repeat protein
MECPKCKQDYGEMITICPLCFIEIVPPAQYSTSRDRRTKKERDERSDSKSKGLLGNALSGWFGKSTSQESQPIQEKVKRRERDFSKSSAADYASFSIGTSVTETPGVMTSHEVTTTSGDKTSNEVTFTQNFSSVPPFSGSSANIITTDSDFFNKTDVAADGPITLDSFTPATGPSSSLSYELPKPAKKGSPSQLPAPSREQLAQEHYRKGYEYEKQNRLKEALVEYGQSVYFNPKWPEPYYRWGLILIKNKDYNTALQKLHEVVKLEPGNADASYQLGKIYIDKNLKEDGEKYLKLALQNNPKLTAAKNLLESIYRKVSSVTQKNCVKCGTPQNTKAKFCGNCGYTFPQ